MSVSIGLYWRHQQYQVCVTQIVSTNEYALLARLTSAAGLGVGCTAAHRQGTARLRCRSHHQQEGSGSATSTAAAGVGAVAADGGRAGRNCLPCSGSQPRSGCSIAVVAAGQGGVMQGLVGAHLSPSSPVAAGAAVSTAEAAPGSGSADPVSLLPYRLRHLAVGSQVSGQLSPS